MALAQRRWTAQPNVTVGIDWAHPRARGLCLFMPLGEAYGLVDLVSGRRASPTGLATRALSGGVAARLFGASNYGDFTAPAAIGPSTPFSVAWTQEPRSTSAYSTVLNVQFGTAGVHWSFLVYLAAADATYYFTAGPRVATGAQSWGASVGAATNKALDRYVLRCAGGSQSLTASDYTLHRNGMLMARGSATNFGTNTAAVARIGALDTGGDPFEGPLHDLRMWSRVLSDGETVDESRVERAAALYLPRRGTIWMAGVPGGSTLVAADQTARATQTAGLGTAIALLGAQAASAAQAAALATAVPLLSSARAAATQTGTLTTGLALAGTEVAAATQATTLATGIALAAAQAAAATQAGVLTTGASGAIDAAQRASAAQTAALTTGVVVLAQHAAGATQVATLTTVAGGAIDATHRASATQTAALLTGVALQAAQAASASQTTDLVAQASTLAAAAIARAQVSASLATGMALAAQHSGRASMLAALAQAFAWFEPAAERTLDVAPQDSVLEVDVVDSTLEA